MVKYIEGCRLVYLNKINLFHLVIKNIKFIQLILLPLEMKGVFRLIFND